MTKEKYILLYEKFLSGKCTLEEEKAIQEYGANIKLRDREWDELLMGRKEEVRKSILSNLQDQLIISQNNTKVRHYIIKWSVAAAVILILSAGIYFNSGNEDHSQNLTSKNLRFQIDIPAGKDRAVLTLDNGSEIILDNTHKGVIVKQGNSEIKKGQGGQLVYSVIGNSSEVLKAKYNVVTTPAGGQYQIVLPDGTKVWLNSASSLRFPTTFTEKNRNVELSGEAYFEVAENKAKPFKVLVKGMEIKVLGTHFNVMAYSDESNVKTTLIEGSVQISEGAKKEYLKPGQQASFIKETATMRIANVDVEHEVAWKNGYFVFNNEDIQSIMRKVGRWYNVEINFEGDLSNKDFIGKVSRSENISEILNALELTETVHFKIEGRRITVMP